jgi:hypothetical protein
MFIQTISWKTLYIDLILSMILAYSQIEIYEIMNLFIFLLIKGSWVWIAYEKYCRLLLKLWKVKEGGRCGR